MSGESPVPRTINTILGVLQTLVTETLKWVFLNWTFLLILTNVSESLLIQEET